MYTERVIHLAPNKMFDQLAKRYHELELQGWLDLSIITIASVIILRKPVAGFSADTKLFWAYGSDIDMDADAAFGPNEARFPNATHHNIDFHSPMDIFQADMLTGIDFDANGPTENEWMMRYPMDLYLSLIHGLRTHC